ncbi:MAG: hypothetical protein J0I06_13915 [Planctomycetes bacterium]|nr:hypothetical protein [Planctomycetota bacterium]
MSLWPTHWLAWARDSLLRRARPRPLSAAVGYERAGGTRWDAPVPWTADAAVVDVLVRLPLTARRKTDFAFRLPFATFPADSIRPDLDDRCRVTFRFPVPLDTLRGDLLWKGRVLASIPVHVLTPGLFLAGLAMVNPTVSVRLGGSTVAATSFVPDRCEGLIAAALLRCSSALAPLAELGLKVVFHDEAAGRTHAVPVALTAAQLARSEAVVAAACPAVPRQAGGWWVTWTAGDRVLTTQRVHATAADRFESGVRLLESRFVVVDTGGAVRTAKLPPSLVGAERIGPCFVLGGGEAGAAAVCRFEVMGVSTGELYPVLWRDAEAVVTDAPSVFAPALFDAAQLDRVSGFELRLNGRLLGMASLRPVPAAALNAEGGFVPPPEFTWSSAADDELADRLKRLQ